MGYFGKGKHRRSRKYRQQDNTLADTRILEKVAYTIEETCGVDHHMVSPTKRFNRDLDIDELTMVEVIVQCEYVFDMGCIPSRTVDKFKTVQNLIDYIIIHQDSEIRRPTGTREALV